MPTRPHLLLFNPDQWRGDFLGHLGCPAAVTPTLDRLVREEAVSFRNTFCQNPVCTPSRCSFMTGWYPHVRGHRTMHHLLDPSEPCLLRRLKESGYYVFWAGKNDLISAEHSLDPYCDERSAPEVEQPSSHSLLADAAEPYSFFLGRLSHDPSSGVYRDGDWAHILAAIERIRTYPDSDAGRAGQPLCLYLPISYPHPPYGVEEPFCSDIDREAVTDPLPAGEGKSSMLAGIQKNQGLQRWTPEQWRELRAVYLGMCARVDEQFRQVLDALREVGLYDETATFFFSDHGDYTGDYGIVEKAQNTFEDCVTRVPMIVKPPAGVECRPGIRDGLVELIDLPATIEDLCDLPVEHTHFGRSLRAALTNPRAELRDAVFCEGGRLPDEQHTREAQSEGDADQHSPYYPRLALQVGDGPEHGKGVMCRTARFKYVRRLLERDEFYDLELDPGELTNQIDHPDYAVTISEMRDRILTWFLETGDAVPFAQGRRW